MSEMTLERVELAGLTVPHPGWKAYDPMMLQKLEKSLQVYGQLKPLVIRDSVILDGRNLRQAMLNLGWTHAMAVQAPVGPIELAMDIEFETDYVALSRYIRDLEMPPTELATVSRFSSERLRYFIELLYFDWSQFQLEEEQPGLWEEEATPHDTRKSEPVGLMPEQQAVAPLQKTVRIKPAAPSRAAAPPPPPPPPRPAAPPRPSMSPGAHTGARGPGARVAAPVPQEPFPDNPVTPTDVLVRFSGGPSIEETNWRPEEPPSLDGVTEIELDTETNGLRWYAGERPIGISIRRPDGRRWYLPWGHAGGNLDEALVKRWAERELRDKTITGANIKFDTHMLREWGINLEEQNCRVSDVMHYAALLDDYRREFNLDALARDFLGKHKSGQELDKTRMAEYHASAVAGYAMDDVTLTGELRTAMWPLMTEQGLHKVRELEENVIYPVCEMEKNAAPIDRDLLKHWVKASAEEMHGLLMEVAEEVGFQVNPDKTDDMVRLFEKLHLPITQFTDKGAPSFTDSLLKYVDHPVVQKARRAGKLASLRSKFITSYDNVVGDDCLLRFELHQLRGDEYGTNRGRFSSSNKNIQQVMGVDKQRLAWGYDEDDDSHDDEIYLIRKLFIAGNPKTHKVLTSDAEQIEYRLAVHFGDMKKLIEAYKENPRLSYHKFTGNMLQPYVPDIPYGKIKITNFLLLYGGGEENMAGTLELSAEKAREFFSIYHREFPDIKPLLRKASELAKHRGFVRTISGRRQRFPDPAYSYKAFNAVDQGSAADIMKQKLYEVHRARKVTGFIMRMPVHDELVGDSPDQKCADMVNEILNQQSFDLKVPILWKTAMGENWAEC